MRVTAITAVAVIRNSVQKLNCHQNCLIRCSRKSTHSLFPLDTQTKPISTSNRTPLLKVASLQTCASRNASSFLNSMSSQMHEWQSAHYDIRLYVNVSIEHRALLAWQNSASTKHKPWILAMPYTDVCISL